MAAVAAPAIQSRLVRGGAARWLPWLLIAPSVVMLLLLIAYPLAFALKSSFWFWNLQTSAEPVGFVGLGNYNLIFQTSDFETALVNTLLLAVSGTAIELALGLAIALMLYTRLPGMSVTRALLIMPTTMAPIIVGFLFRYLYTPNRRASSPGAGAALASRCRSAVCSAAQARRSGACSSADIWQWTPFCAIVLYAGLLGVPGELVEAAMLDGAGFWTSLLRIRLPLAKATIAIVVMLRFMQLFNTFDLVLVLTRGGPGNASRTLGYTLYQQGLVDFNIGLASATTWLMVLIVNALIALYIAVTFRNWRW